jgi:hypothetical protein
MARPASITRGRGGASTRRSCSTTVASAAICALQRPGVRLSAGAQQRCRHRRRGAHLERMPDPFLFAARTGRTAASSSAEPSTRTGSHFLPDLPAATQLAGLRAADGGLGGVARTKSPALQSPVRLRKHRGGWSSSTSSSMLPTLQSNSKTGLTTTGDRGWPLLLAVPRASVWQGSCTGVAAVAASKVVYRRADFAQG